MTNDELKERVIEYLGGEEEASEVIVLEGDEFADGVIGITDDNRLVYSYENLVVCLAKAFRESDTQEGRTDEDYHTDAIEWLDYNTTRSLPYMGGNAPIIVHDLNLGGITIDDLTERIASLRKADGADGQEYVSVYDVLETIKRWSEGQ